VKLEKKGLAAMEGRVWVSNINGDIEVGDAVEGLDGGQPKG
jgi:hypothetical protein